MATTNAFSGRLNVQNPQYTVAAWAPASTPTQFQSRPHPSAVHSSGSRPNRSPNDLATDESFIILVVCSILSALSLSAVILRLASGVVKRRFNATDGATLIAFILAMGLWAESFMAVSLGAGKHLPTLPVSSIYGLLKVLFDWKITHHLAKLATQLAILLMLKDAFTLKNRYFKWAWVTVAFLTDLTCVAAVGLDILTCSPIQHAWDPTVPGFCFDPHLLLAICNGAIGVTSVMTLALPILPIIFAKVSWRRKACMGALWFFAFFITWCIGAYITCILYLGSSPDFSFNIVPLIIISVVEVCAGIIVACVPAIEQLFRRDQASSPAPEEEEEILKPTLV